MSLKQQAAEAFTEVEELLAKLPDAESRAKGQAAVRTVNRFAGELRQDKAAFKSQAEEAEAKIAPLKQRVIDLEQQLTSVREQLHSTKQQLESQVMSAKREEKRQSPQGRLESLVKGVDQPITDEERVERRKQLRRLVEWYTPELARYVNVVAKSGPGTPIVGLTQDSFAADYHADEYTLLGMCIKYAGECGVSVVMARHSPTAVTKELRRRLLAGQRFLKAGAVHALTESPRDEATDLSEYPDKDLIQALKDADIEIPANISRQKLEQLVIENLAKEEEAEEEAEEEQEEDQPRNRLDDFID